MNPLDMWEFEHVKTREGYRFVCGVDEAGRGPLAGPVCAAAVILPPHLEIPGLNDSKKRSDKRRRELMPVIKEQAITYGIGMASHEEIDQINILQATFLAMERALAQLEGTYPGPKTIAQGVLDITEEMMPEPGKGIVVEVPIHRPKFQKTIGQVKLEIRA